MGIAAFMPLTLLPVLIDGSERGSADFGQPRQTPATQSRTGGPLHK